MTVEHPQPLGAFGMPAGLLLIPSGDAEVSAVRETLVAGRLPEHWPAALRGHQLLHEGDHEAALAAFDGEDSIAAYNRWVLDPTSATIDQIRGGLPASVQPLIDAVGAMVGQSEVPAHPGDDVPADIRTVALAARASASAEQGDVATAVTTFEEAAEAARPVSVALAGLLLGNAGVMARQLPGPDSIDRAERALREAERDLDGSALTDVRAELLHELGSLAQERAASGVGDPEAHLMGGIKDYYEALKLVSETSDPHLWASLNMNLATAHLAIPMSKASDQLRLGVATQALRACRRVFTPQTHPGPWSSATLNLANALVYTPSTHQADNLVEAVELYEEVLESGTRSHDPLGRARVLANQGNTLAHLGAFEPAKAKLVEARYIFEEHLDHDSAMSVRSILDEIAKAGVHEPDDELADLARQAEQMSRIPTSEGTFTSGMGVTVAPTPKVTVLESGQIHPDLPPDHLAGGEEA